MSSELQTNKLAGRPGSDQRFHRGIVRAPERGRGNLIPVVVGISDCRVSDDPEEVLVTHALGSCIAVMVHDPSSGAAGLLHFMLPEASLIHARAAQNPCMFADTGIQELFRMMSALGANRRHFAVRIAGGAQVLSGHEELQIGRRNYLAARDILWKEGLRVVSEAVGGVVSRSVRLEVRSGRTLIREGVMETTLRQRFRSRYSESS